MNSTSFQMEHMIILAVLRDVKIHVATFSNLKNAVFATFSNFILYFIYIFVSFIIDNNYKHN